MKHKTDELKKISFSVLEQEASEIIAGKDSIDQSFIQSINLIHKKTSEGKLIVIGMGKSGHIGSKIAATLASTGTPSFYVHPGEAGHGDLGMLTSKDIVLSISQSGESYELTQLIPYIKRMKIPLISMTGNFESTLARSSDFIISTQVSAEACPMGLAPTTSTTKTLALGDAMAICLLTLNGFTKEKFAETHPSGLLGRRLLTFVKDVMTSKDLPTIKENVSIKDALSIIASGCMGIVLVMDNDNLKGVFTDGDLRRTLDKDNIDIRNTNIKEVMTTSFISTESSVLAIDALNIMEVNKISALPVLEKGKLVGVISLQALLNSGIV